MNYAHNLSCGYEKAYWFVIHILEGFFRAFKMIYTNLMLCNIGCKWEPSVQVIFIFNVLYIIEEAFYCTLHLLRAFHEFLLFDAIKKSIRKPLKWSLNIILRPTRLILDILIKYHKYILSILRKLESWIWFHYSVISHQCSSNLCHLC